MTEEELDVDRLFFLIIVVPYVARHNVARVRSDSRRQLAAEVFENVFRHMRHSLQLKIYNIVEREGSMFERFLVKMKQYTIDVRVIM